ncbi:MAG: ABC transporter substrate-binding protein [Verrucomicrobiota bacterium]
MSKRFSAISFRVPVILVALLVLLSGCGENPREDGRVVIQYWDKWTGSEHQAMQDLVDDFNASQNEIYVEFLSISFISRKLMLAAAGGNPPDLAGLWSMNVPIFAANGALTQLDDLAASHDIHESDYLPAIWSELTEFDRLWGLPSTPGATGLHWNKDLFREAGLDPEKPPRTIAELEAFNEHITRFDDDGDIEVLGHLPQEPGWWLPNWAYWFGGDVWNRKDAITVESDASIAALEWMASYPERFGADELLRFRQASGNFASAENPFFNGRIAMVHQGPWMHNFIEKFAPKSFDWGVAPFPSTDPDRYGVAIVETDVIVIPRGAKHPQEAFKFLSWLQRPENLEKLCAKQLKFSPLVETSESFYENHPNPKIKIYRELAESPYASGRSRLTNIMDFNRDMVNAFDQVALQNLTPEEAAAAVQRRQGKLFDQSYRRWLKVRDARLEDKTQP